MVSQSQKRFTSDSWLKLALVLLALGVLVKSQFDIVTLRHELASNSHRLDELARKIEELNTALPEEDDEVTETLHWKPNQQMVRKVQRILRGLHVYDRPIDGIYGLWTTRGLRRFQQNNDLEATGQLTEETYQLLIAHENLAGN